MDNKDNKFEFETEVLTRLVAIETKIDSYKETEKVANEANQRSINNEKDISEMKENNKWLKKAVATAIISAIFAIILTIVEKGVGLK